MQDANATLTDAVERFQTKAVQQQNVRITADIVCAYVAKNPVPVGELPALIKSVHAALAGLDQSVDAVPLADTAPAVPIKKSVTDDYIICLEDGEKFKSLKRHLSSKFGMTPEEYRMKWGLPSDYPMVSKNYAEHRSELAKRMGLGRKAA